MKAESLPLSAVALRISPKPSTLPISVATSMPLGFSVSREITSACLVAELSDAQRRHQELHAADLVGERVSIRARRYHHVAVGVDAGRRHAHFGAAAAGI